MLKPRNDARLSPCEAFWQKHNGFLCEKPILPYEHSAFGISFLLQFILQSANSQFHKYFLINSWTFYIIKIDTNAKTDFYERVNYVQYSCC